METGDTREVIISKTSLFKQYEKTFRLSQSSHTWLVSFRLKKLWKRSRAARSALAN